MRKGYPLRSQTFAARVRAELARVRAPRECCRRAELVALVRSAGTFHILPGGRFALEVEASHAAVARVVYESLTQAGAAPEIRLFAPGRSRPQERYVVRVEAAGRRLFARAGALDRNGSFARGVPRSVAARRCCSAAYLRGAFVAHGSVTPPRTPAHLEVHAADEPAAAGLAALAEKLGASAKVRAHRGWAAYTKDVASVGRLLAAMGAHRGFLEWESAGVWAAVRNEANRLANCDEANVARTVRASVIQREAIRRLEDRPGLHRIAPALRAAAVARLEHPDASLDELASILGVSKSAVADRVRRLMRLADKESGGPEPAASLSLAQ